MTVQEEVDALSTMGLNPIRYLVVPRCLALVLMLPCLTVIADCMGMLGGFLVGTIGIGINPWLYISKNFDSLTMMDMNMGLTKSFLFAYVIARPISWRATLRVLLQSTFFQNPLLFLIGQSLIVTCTRYLSTVCRLQHLLLSCIASVDLMDS